MKWFGDYQARFYLGEVREVCAGLAPESIDCAMTSPPYWALRDYGVEPSVWGGEAGCEHAWGAEGRRVSTGGVGSTTIGNGLGQATSAGTFFECSTGAFCQRCPAWRGQLGLEPSPEQFIGHLVECFAAVHEVLVPNGVLWVNIGDTWASGGGGGAGVGKTAKVGNTRNGVVGDRPARQPPNGVQVKEQIGIPWMLAFAMRAAGWRLRQEVIWHKPNPMPESVRDRCTKAHESLFLFTKSERYWWCPEAIQEPAEWARWGDQTVKKYERTRTTTGGIKPETHAALTSRKTRNKRSVWSIPTKPYLGAHFATFPPKLVEPVVLASCPPGGVIMDPFMGAGTVGVVAKQHQRRFIGIDAKREYVEMAMKRIADA